jgi:hypothetical protein
MKVNAVKKVLFVLAALIALAAPSMAQSIVTQPVTESLAKGLSCGPVSISSYSSTSVATQVLGSTSATNSYSYVRIHDLDGTGNIYANDVPTVSTTTTAGTMGEPISNSGTTVNVLDFPLKPGQLWYATCDKTTGPCTAIICKGR